MTEEQRKEIADCLTEFIKRACGKGALPEEVRILPGVIQAFVNFSQSL